MSPPGLSSASVTVPRPRPRRAARTAPCQRDPHTACRPGPRLPVPSFPAPCVGHTSLMAASSGDSSPQFADRCREPPPLWTGGLHHAATSGSHQNGASQRGPRISRHWTTHHTGGHRAEAPGDDSALGPAGTNPVVFPLCLRVQAALSELVCLSYTCSDPMFSRRHDEVPGPNSLVASGHLEGRLLPAARQHGGLGGHSRRQTSAAVSARVRTHLPLASTRTCTCVYTPAPRLHPHLPECGCI